jgi:hypothetical protein
VLRRQADAGGLKGWSDAVASGVSERTLRQAMATSCCADADQDGTGAMGHGWPPVNDAFLDLAAANLFNVVQSRLGPSRPRMIGTGGERPNKRDATWA